MLPCDELRHDVFYLKLFPRQWNPLRLMKLATYYPMRLKGAVFKRRVEMTEDSCLE